MDLLRPLALAMVLTSCGASPRTETTTAPATQTEATEAAHPAIDTTPPAPPEEPGPCGASIAESRGHRCADGDACTVSDGSCTCPANVTYARHCGGAAYIEEPSTRPSIWVCTPSDPTADRGDGCPFTQPTAETPCTSTAASCSYGAVDGCGHFSGAMARCEAGQWAVDISMPIPYQ